MSSAVGRSVGAVGATGPAGTGTVGSTGATGPAVSPVFLFLQKLRQVTTVFCLFNTEAVW